jgi:hypothetical protein
MEDISFLWACSGAIVHRNSGDRSVAEDPGGGMPRADYQFFVGSPELLVYRNTRSRSAADVLEVYCLAMEGRVSWFPDERVEYRELRYPPLA